MRSLKVEYFLAFGVMGAVLPYLPLFLDERGLTEVQIGWVIATTGVAVLLTPVLLTMLADLRLESRTLLAGTFGLSILGLVGLLGSHAFWPILLAHLVYAVSVFPVMPLQDGLNFAVQAQRQQRGLPEVPYHRIRVWGTLGFLVPSLVLWVWLTYDNRVSLCLVVAIAFSALALINTRWLPAARESGGSAPLPAARPPRRVLGLFPRAAPLPTLAALRAMTRGPVLVFALATWLANIAVAAYYAFYPIYLKDMLGIEPKWAGLISNLGVLIEVVFMLGFGFLLRWFGLRWLMALGAAGIAARFLLLALFPNIYVAVGTQVLHGMLVLVVHVAPPIYLNAQAQGPFRNSIQGLYAMAVVGTGRILGNALSGYAAEASLLGVFAAAAVVAALAAVLFAVMFRDPDPAPAAQS